MTDHRFVVRNKDNSINKLYIKLNYAKAFCDKNEGTEIYDKESDKVIYSNTKKSEQKMTKVETIPIYSAKELQEQSEKEEREKLEAEEKRRKEQEELEKAKKAEEIKNSKEIYVHPVTKEEVQNVKPGLLERIKKLFIR